MKIFNDMDMLKEVSKTYNFFIDIFKYPYRDKIIRNSDSFINNGRNFFTMISTTMSYLLGYSYEKCKDFDDEIIDNVLKEFPFWNQIDTKKNMTPIEKFKQFRNCFEHANFLLIIDNNDNQDISNENIYIKSLEQISYVFGNDYIEGAISFKELFILFNKCIGLFTKYNSKNSISMYIFNDKNGYTIKNKKDALNVTKNIVVCDITVDKNSLAKEVNIKIDNTKLTDGIHYGTIYSFHWNKEEYYTDLRANILNVDRIRYYISNKTELGMNQISIVNRLATKEEQEKIYNYLEIVTKNFTRPYIISTDFINQLFLEHDLCFKANDVFYSLFFELHNKGKHKISLESLQKSIWDKYDSSQYYDDIVAQAPSLYFTTLIASANYHFNYIYEVNKKMGSEIFKYKNINLDDIEIENLTSDKLVKVTDPLFNEKEEKTRLEKELLEMPNKLEWAKRQKTILNNPKNKDPKKEEKLVYVTNFIQTYNEELKKIKDRYDYICNYINSQLDAETYVDSNHLFRHLRNSVSHGRFKIDHDPGYKSKDFGNSIIELYDYDEDTDRISIKVKMTLNRFEKLLKELSSNVYSQLNETEYNEISKRIVGYNSQDESNNEDEKETKAKKK